MKLLEQKIESLLFFKNEPLSLDWLSRTLEVPLEMIRETVNTMSHYYDNRGISLVVTDNAVALMTSDSAQEIINSLVNTKEEKELSKQALETLSIIIYKQKSTKSEIDYIRGVNSIFILRNLLIRGLITKEANPHDKRSPYYMATHEMLSFLGVQKISELPKFEKIQQKISEINKSYRKENQDDFNDSDVTTHLENK